MNLLSDEQAVDMALSFNDFEREVILLCARKSSIGYARMAEALDAPYRRVQTVGRLLQAKRLAYVDTVRNVLDNYAGSALFLNARGEQVRHVLNLQKRLREQQ